MQMSLVGPDTIDCVISRTCLFYEGTYKLFSLSQCTLVLPTSLCIGSTRYYHVYVDGGFPTHRLLCVIFIDIGRAIYS